MDERDTDAFKRTEKKSNLHISILEEAQGIVRKGGVENSERRYGTPLESFGKIALVASIICDKEITLQDVAKIQIAQKLVRESYAHKRDNLVDLCGYASILNDLEDE
jgi:hypothetical protein